MNEILLDKQVPYFVTVIAIGSHGCQALSELRRYPWWLYVCQQFCEDSLFKYIAVDNKPINPDPAIADEWLLIDTRLDDNQTPPLRLIDASTQQKLDQWQGDMTYIICDLRNDALTDLFIEIAGHFSDSLVVSVIVEPQSETDLPAFYERIARIKPTAGSLIVNSANQVRQQLVESRQTDNGAWYWSHQYKAISNILCGITSTLQKGFVCFDFADLRTILQPEYEAKAFYLTMTGASQAQQAVEKALALIRQEDWDLTDTALRGCLWNCLTNGNLEFSEFNEITTSFLEILKEDVKAAMLVRANKTLKSTESGLFLLVTKGDKIKYNKASQVSDEILEYLDIPDSLKYPFD